MKIVFDTNFLMLPAQLGVNIFKLVKDEYLNPEIIILDCVLEELKNIAKSNKEAKLALSILESNKHSFVNNGSNKRLIDNKILDYCISNSCLLATQDKVLKEKALKKRVRVLILTQKSFLKEVK